MNTHNIPLNNKDTRYTIYKTANKYIALFCNIPLHSEAYSLQSVLVLIQTHEQKQQLAVFS
jgi:hypothetical protein